MFDFAVAINSICDSLYQYYQNLKIIKLHLLNLIVFWCLKTV